MTKIIVHQSTNPIKETVETGDLVYTGYLDYYMVSQVDRGVLKLIGLNNGNRLSDRTFSSGSSIEHVKFICGLPRDAVVIKSNQYTLTLEY